MANSYIKAEIHLDEIGVGSIAIMEWIKAHGCPVLDFTSFYDARGHCSAIVSSKNKDELILDIEEYDWIEVGSGLKRCTPVLGIWLLSVNDNLYLLTI